MRCFRLDLLTCLFDGRRCLQSLRFPHVPSGSFLVGDDLNQSVRDRNDCFERKSICIHLSDVLNANDRWESTGTHSSDSFDRQWSRLTMRHRWTHECVIQSGFLWAATDNNHNVLLWEPVANWKRATVGGKWLPWPSQQEHSDEKILCERKACLCFDAQIRVESGAKRNGEPLWRFHFSVFFRFSWKLVELKCSNNATDNPQITVN